MKGKLCGWVGCSVIVTDGNYYCSKHKAIADARRKQHQIFEGTKRTSSKPYHNMYESERWRMTRKAFLIKYPYCFRCGAKATIADHIVPHKGNPDLFYNEDNLQPMCWSCHSAKTLAENNHFRRNK